MNREKKIVNNKLFAQAGQDLLRKVQHTEATDRQAALASWEELEAKMKKERPTFRLRPRYVWSVAASVAVLFCVGVYFWMNGSQDSSMTLALLEKTPASLPGNEILLVEQGDKMQLKDEASIQYNTEGKSNAEENIVRKEEANQKEKAAPKKEIKEEINQIIVPKGRRVDITFADGTRMYVNSDTRVFYPSVFRKDKREIVVEGEVYLEVKKDPARPFIVKANGFDVKVRGTQFNVCAYKNEKASVVLVDGRVEVQTGKKEKAVLAPNQMMKISEEGTDIKEVDVLEYICWKDNMMLLNGRKVGETLDRLSRYYGRTIHYSEEIGSIPVSGKLDLRENMEDVVNILCQLLFLQYETDENDNILISKQ